MSQLNLRFLSAFRVTVAGQPIQMKRLKVRGLLAYLAVEQGQAHERAKLTGLLWPEMPEQTALRNLTQTLSLLRRAIGDRSATPPFLIVTRQTIQFNLNSYHKLDVASFQKRLQANEITQLEKGVAIYQGEFLPAFSLPHCHAFDDWLLQTRTQLHNQALIALHKVTNHFLETANFAKAQQYAQRQLELDAWRETAYLQLMQALALAGQRTAALAQYEKCRQLLADELGMEPGAELAALYEQIRQGDKKTESPPHPLSPSPKQPQVAHNLPPQPTSFIGREIEVAEIVSLLADPEARLLTLVGPGGMGKTRLAIQAATEMATTYADGVCFVSLASVASPDLMPATIAQTLNLSPGSADLKEQIIRFLQKREMLLLLDNMEHLLPAVAESVVELPTSSDFIAELLTRAPNVKALVTSRERFNLQQEWIFPLEGLLYPQSEEIKNLTAFDAILLFADRFRRVQPAFSLEKEAKVVRQICQLAGGMPLALELAAAWGRLMSCQEIAEEIANSLDFLKTKTRNMPARHRNMKAVFESSWRLLEEAEQNALARLSLFRGGFTRDAAEVVTGLSLDMLSILVDKSLIRRQKSDGRYEILELLRQFAAEKLTALPAEPKRTQTAHAHYYAAYLERQEDILKAEEQPEALNKIAADIDNIRLAWGWAVNQRSAALITQSFFSLWYFWLFRGPLQEAEISYRKAVTALRPQSATEELSSEQQISLGQLLAGQGYCLSRLGLLKQSSECLQEALTILRRAKPNNRWSLAQALLFWSYLSIMQGKRRLAKQSCQEAINIFHELDDTWGQGLGLRILGLAYEWEGSYSQAETTLKKCIELLNPIGERKYFGLALNGLGRIALAHGQYEEANNFLERCMTNLNAQENQRDKAYVLRDLGHLALEQGNLKLAQKQFSESVRIAEEFSERNTFVLSNNGLGRIVRLHGYFEQAEALHQECLTISRERDYVLGISHSLYHLACVAYDRGLFIQAEQLCQESLKMSSETRWMPFIAPSWLQLSYASCMLGEAYHKQACQWLHKTLSLSLERQMLPLILGSFVGIALWLTESQPEEREKAVELLSLAIANPATPYETKKMAQRLLTDIIVEMPAEIVTTAQTRGQHLDWRKTAQNWLDLLPSPTK